MDVEFLISKPANVHILCPLKTPENLWFSGVFRGYKMQTSAGNGLKNGKKYLTALTQSRSLSRSEKEMSIFSILKLTTSKLLSIVYILPFHTVKLEQAIFHMKLKVKIIFSIYYIYKTCFHMSTNPSSLIGFPALNASIAPLYILTIKSFVQPTLVS